MAMHFAMSHALRAASAAAGLIYPEDTFVSCTAALAAAGIASERDLHFAFSTAASQRDIPPFLQENGFDNGFSVVLVTAALCADPSRVKAPVSLKRQRSPSPLRNSFGRFVPLPAACAPVVPSSSVLPPGSNASARTRAAARAIDALVAGGLIPDPTAAPVIKASRAAPNMTFKIVAAQAKVSKHVISLLKLLGPMSPRFVEVYGAPGSPDPVAGAPATFAALAAGRRNPSVSLNYCAELAAFLLWLRAAGRTPASVTELSVAAYISQCRGRGRSVPNRVRSALLWAQRVYDIPFHAGTVSMRDLVSGISSYDKGAGPVEAVMMPIDLVILLEGLVTSAPSVPLRVFAGCFVALAHGCKRWADLQYLSGIKEGEHAIVLTTWKSKRKLSSMVWAVLRSGFAGSDWCSPWLAALKLSELPGIDFVSWLPTANLKDFLRSPALWADAQRALIALLLLGGVNHEEAVLYNTHSFRHIAPTIGLQLQVPEPVLNAMGNWAGPTPMVGKYNSSKNSHVLAAKLFIIQNVRRG